MLNVSDATMEAYTKDGVHKTIRVFFPELNLTFSNSQIVKDSLSISESIYSGKSIEFVGCNSSTMNVKIYNANYQLKGKRVEVYIRAGETEEIPVFKGIVDKATIQAERAFKEIEAYDILYTIGQKEIASWYNSISYPTTIGAIRRSLYSYVNLPYVDDNLPNDSIVIPEKQFENIESMQALVAIKSICQINGCFGIINRNGYFQHKFISGAYDMLIPGDDTYPGDDVFPSDADRDSGRYSFNLYKSIEYDEYYVKPVDRIQIRDEDDDPGIIYGAQTGNKYIIQGNMFAYGLPAGHRNQIAANIINIINKVSYHPSKISNMGMPFLECGDIVTYPITRKFGEQGNYDVDTFMILSRTLKGEQILTDSYTSEGEEEQSEFITDIQNQLNALKRAEPDMSNYYDMDQIDSMIDELPTMDEIEPFVMDEVATQVNDLETPTGFNIVSCYALPSNPQANTLYCIQGMTIIL